VPASKAPAVLRLAFHDAGTYRVSDGLGGANGSILYELDRPESFGLKRGLRPVQDALEALRGTPAAGLSLADLIQLAGAHAVAVTGGPLIRVPLGRLDASSGDPEGRMPEETLDGAGLRAHFAAAGLSAREMVALSGAHTLGSKGFGPPLAFDSAYYSTLLARPWADKDATPEARAMAEHIGLASDKALAEDAPSAGFIRRYALDGAAWFDDFAAAYVKMGCLGARWAPGVAPGTYETRE
jgi:L-ascorbate peroxidase